MKLHELYLISRELAGTWGTESLERFKVIYPEYTPPPLLGGRGFYRKHHVMIVMLTSFIPNFFLSHYLSLSFCIPIYPFFVYESMHRTEHWSWAFVLVANFSPYSCHSSLILSLFFFSILLLLCTHSLSTHWTQKTLIFGFRFFLPMF